MKTKLAQFAVSALLMLFAIAVSACGGEDESDGGPGQGGQGATPAEPSIPSQAESAEFKMGIQPWLGYGQWYVAKEEGFLSDVGIDKLELVNFTTDDQLNAGLASGKLDGANVATHTALKLLEAGLPIKIVLLEDVSTTADAIIAAEGVAEIADLRGKKVAYEEGTTSDILLRYALAQNGMSIEDVEPVPIPAADAGTALIAGRVPVAVTYEPYLTTALEREEGTERIYTAGEKPGLISDVLVVTEDVLAERPGQVAALVRAWGEAVDFYRSDSQAGQRIIADAVGEDPEALQSAFEGVEYFGLSENQEQLAGEFATETVNEVEDVARDGGILQGDVDTEGLIDTRFVEAAAQQSGG